MLYYAALFFIYHYLVYRYVHDTLESQLLGLGDTLAVSAVLAGFLAACAIPPFIWSRRSYSHPLWRGLECFICYALVALVLGAIFAAMEEGDWSIFSGLAVKRGFLNRVGSLLVLFAVFMAAAWWGGKGDGKREARRRGRRVRKSGGKAATS
jgi:hypothetical protein